jgi:hypothetical protein
MQQLHVSAWAVFELVFQQTICRCMLLNLLCPVDSGLPVAVTFAVPYDATCCIPEAACLWGGGLHNNQTPDVPEASLHADIMRNKLLLCASC